MLPVVSGDLQHGPGATAGHNNGGDAGQHMLPTMNMSAGMGVPVMQMMPTMGCVTKKKTFFQ
jgi:predicted heme/steroid binding protein